MIKRKAKHIIKLKVILWLKKNFGKCYKEFEEVNNKFGKQDEDESEMMEEIRKDPDANLWWKVQSQRSILKWTKYRDDAILRHKELLNFWNQEGIWF
jgi:hypothetical protein